MLLAMISARVPARVPKMDRIMESARTLTMVLRTADAMDRK